MKTIIVNLFLFMANLSLVFGGEIYGTITENGKPIGAGVKVQILINNNCQETSTDSRGFYDIQVTEKGKGELIILYENQNPSHPIYSSSTAVRYDFALVKENGKYVLRRE
jgi:hypothetical protein